MTTPPHLASLDVDYTLYCNSMGRELPMALTEARAPDDVNNMVQKKNKTKNLLQTKVKIHYW